MMGNEFFITVFEHEWLRTDRENSSGKILPVDCYKALCEFFGEKGVPYYSLIHKGVKFCHYVGVLQVGKYAIEILPKADKSAELQDKKRWQGLLIHMLKNSGLFPIEAPTSSNLGLTKNNVLDLYIQLFVDGVNKLIQEGLLKKYRNTEGNVSSLKGRLMFGKQLRVNLIHKERFYTTHFVYDQENIFNQIVFKTLILISNIASYSLASEAARIMLSFPDCKSILVNEKTFDYLKIDRKTERYEYCLGIARLLLLNYHPDVNKGMNNVLALMFDMNSLWEKYVLYQLRRASRLMDNISVSSQEIEIFWNGRYIRPDIVVRCGEDAFVIDTKWKALEFAEPSVEDIRQMYAYNHHFKSKKSFLLYPNVYGLKNISANYVLPNLHVSGVVNDHSCGVLFIDVVDDLKNMDIAFGLKVLNLLFNGTDRD